MPIRTKAQNTRLHALLVALNIDTDQKLDFVIQFSNERVFSSADLTVDECQAFISHLQALKDGFRPAQRMDNDPANKQRRKILAICHEMHWTKNGKVDMIRLNAFLEKSGHLHKKNLNEYQLNELPTLVSQFEQLLKSYYAKSKV